MSTLSRKIAMLAARASRKTLAAVVARSRYEARLYLHHAGIDVDGLIPLEPSVDQSRSSISAVKVSANGF